MTSTPLPSRTTRFQFPPVPTATSFFHAPPTGKSTFYQQRFANTHMRINLDMLKTRTREDILLEACIRAQQSFVVDNTNVLRREREKYIRLAKAAGYAVIGYYFQSRLGDSLQRNQQREGKAVIPEKGVMAKSRSAPYAAGARGQSWLKVKRTHTLDLAVLAAEWGHGRRRG